MKTKRLVDLLKLGNISVPSYLFSEYKGFGLEDKEFIFLLGLLGKDVIFNYDPKALADFYNFELKEVLEIIQNLDSKNIIKIEVKKNKQGKMSEYIDLSPFYEKVGNIVIENINKKDKDHNLFSTFEKEFGRTLSPIEYEIISKWIEDNISEELILEALKEATYNGVSNLRYIDKILHEWHKKGIKTSKDVKEDYKKFKNNKKQSKEVFDYNWLEEE